MPKRPRINNSNRDYYGGALMAVIGVAAIIGGRDYPIGTLSRMGPGYFPVALGVILTLVGFAIAATARFANRRLPRRSALSEPPQRSVRPRAVCSA